MCDIQFEIILDKEQRILHLIVRGEVEKNMGKKIITEARTKAAENQCNILCDVRQALVKAGLVDWFYLPRDLDVYKQTPFVNTAILIRKKIQEREYKFFETVTHNLGINVKIFFKQEDAIEWLREIKTD